MRASEKSATTRALPRSPICDRSAESAQRRLMAARRDSTSPGGTTSPVTLCWLTQGTPEGNCVEMTGLLHAIASICTRPKASAFVTEGSTNRSQA